MLLKVNHLIIYSLYIANIFFTPISFAPPAASAPSMSPYGQPPQSVYQSMAQAPPPTQQLTNQMSSMNIAGYGK